MSTQASAVNGVSLIGLSAQLEALQAQIASIANGKALHSPQTTGVSPTDPTGFGAKMKAARERKRTQSAAQVAAEASARVMEPLVSTDVAVPVGMVSTDIPLVSQPVTPKRKKRQAIGVGLASIPQVMAQAGVKAQYEPRINVVPIARLANGKLVTMGQSSDPQYVGNIGFRVGDGRVKWGKAETWSTYAACAQGITAYLARLK